jgi:hypothetical protein
VSFVFVGNAVPDLTSRAHAMLADTHSDGTPVSTTGTAPLMSAHAAAAASPSHTTATPFLVGHRAAGTGTSLKAGGPSDVVGAVSEVRDERSLERHLVLLLEEDKALEALQQNLRSSLANTLPSPPLSTGFSAQGVQHEEQRWGGVRTRWGEGTTTHQAAEACLGQSTETAKMSQGRERNAQKEMPKTSSKKVSKFSYV